MNNIPVEVYFIFLILLYVGIKRCRPRLMSIAKLAIMPLLFIALSIKNTMHLFNGMPEVLAALGVGLLLGASLGFLQVKNHIVQADKENQLIQLPGDFSMLAIIMAIFTINFFVHYSIEAHLPIANLLLFKFSAGFLSGLVVGITTGRSIRYFTKYQQAESVLLK